MEIKKINSIDDNDIFELDKSILNILLKDRTTRKNIIWATNDYSEINLTYSDTCQITIDQIIGINKKLILPRVTKAIENQSMRTREKAEVFTPSWICNEQNNLIDEQWFNRKVVFNVPLDKSWETTKEKIQFPDDEKKTWQSYIDARCLEICCGEAPYLVSRYDSVTGEKIEINMRIGLLDRKLRVINENTSSEAEWVKWSIRALQSIYAFEYQGDNLLLARKNILLTFIENLIYKLERLPKAQEVREAAKIISWNIWQMDGINFTVPLGAIESSAKQGTFFEEDTIKLKNDNQNYCIIKDWRANTTKTYKSLLGGNKDG